ncbi:MAG: hypothetical protein ABIP27_04525 [Flavobacterium circumlabens]|uniref:hypothetical protein n=1 Tax=Flavobacterium circumlabens TaxID=2133765 RepID=UPI003265DD59
MVFLYFNPEVWGTVSDWFIAIVTSITAYYLYQTLKSQKEVQETQTKLFEIEKFRFSESIKPNLKFTQPTKDQQIITEDPDKCINSIIVINDSNNDALEGSITMISETKNIEIINGKVFEYFHLRKSETLRLNFILHDTKSSENLLILCFKYKDIANNKYIQYINCDLKANGYSRIYHSFPEIEAEKQNIH